MAKVKQSKKDVAITEKSGKVQRVEPARALSEEWNRWSEHLRIFFRCHGEEVLDFHHCGISPNGRKCGCRKRI